MSAILLAGYLLYVLYALGFAPDDPQEGASRGFLSLALVLLFVCASLLAYGVARGRPWIVHIVFALAVFPAFTRLAQGL